MDSLQVILLLLLSLLSPTLGKNRKDFTGEFFKSVLKADYEGNIIVSPSSLHRALAQVYLGVEGKAASELKDALNLTGSTKDDALKEFRQFVEIPSQTKNAAKMEVGNRLFVANNVPILPQYQAISNETFGAMAETANFKNKALVAETVNGWIANVTHHNKTEFFKSDNFNDTTRLLLVIAVHFSGKWKYEFDKTKSRKRPFYIYSNGQDRKIDDVVSMVLNYDLVSDYNRILNADILSLPYANSDFSMLIILPRFTDGFPFVESKLHLVDFRTVLKGKPARRTQLILPKFKFSQKINLKNVLNNMDIREIFRNPNFSSLTSSKEQLRIDGVMHEASIEVNERGTDDSGERKQTNKIDQHDKTYIFNVNRPFLFAIRDEQHVYFVGRVVNPSYEYNK